MEEDTSSQEGHPDENEDMSTQEPKDRIRELELSLISRDNELSSLKHREEQPQFMTQINRNNENNTYCLELEAKETMITELNNKLLSMESDRVQKQEEISLLKQQVSQHEQTIEELQNIVAAASTPSLSSFVITYEEEYMLAMMRQNPDISKQIGDEFNKIMLKCMRESRGRALEHTSPKWRDDPDVVLAAVKNGCVLSESNFQYASEGLRNDGGFVRQCVKLKTDSLKYASDALLHDKEFIISVMKDVGFALKYVPHFHHDKDVVMSAVCERGSALQYACNELKNDRDVVLSAVKRTASSLEYASDSLRNDGDFILKCIQRVGASLLGARESWSSDGAVPVRWRDDFEFMVRAVRLNRTCFHYASDRLKNVPEFRKAVGFME